MKCLNGGFRDVDSSEVSGPMRPGQLLGVPPVGLDLVAGPSRDLGGSHHDAVVAELDQAAHQDEAARARFVAEVEFGVRAILLAQPGDGLLARGLGLRPAFGCLSRRPRFHRLNVVDDLAVGADLPVTARFCHRDGDGLFVDIKSDIQ